MTVVVAVTGLLAACSREGATEPTSPVPSIASSEGVAIITPQQLQDMMAKEDVYLVNVHVPYEGEIPGTDAHIPYTDIASRLGEIPFDGRSVVIYCRSGVTSGMASKSMVEAGAPPFYELEGGYLAWQAAGFEFNTGSPEAVSG